MALSLTPLPSNRRANDFLPNTDPMTGIVTMTGRPSRHEWANSQALLHALGVRTDVDGTGRRHGEDLNLLYAWLHAYDAKVVVVRHANFIRPTAALDNLLHTVTSAGAHLAVTCDDTLTGTLADWVDDRNGTIHPTVNPLHRLLARKARTVSTEQDPTNDFPQFLPRADFYEFRAACRDVLTPAQFAHVDTLYCDTFRTVTKAQPSTDQAASDLLFDAVANHTSTGEVLTIARATQAALFTQGHLLKIWVPRLLNGVADGDHRRLTPAEIRALRAYRTPWRSAAFVLHDADLSLDQISALTVGQVTTDGGLTGADHLPLHPDARVYLRAQRHYRLLSGATRTDPLVTAGQPQLQRAFRRAGSQLNVPAPGNHTRRRSSRNETWRTTLGVTIAPLNPTKTNTPPLTRKAA